MSKVLIILGIILIITGVMLRFSNGLSFFGKLPGDIRIERENFSFYFPLTSGFLLSAIVSLIFYLFGKWKS